jgi:hypothetical protein
MASSYVETQVTWSAAASITLSSATRQDSDTFTLGNECYEAAVQISVDNAGTPASGDVLDVYAKWTSGDILGDSGDDFDTTEHAQFLGRLDTYTTNTPGEDPARRTYQLPTVPAKVRISVESPNAATRNMVVRARVVEHRAA